VIYSFRFVDKKNDFNTYPNVSSYISVRFEHGAVKAKTPDLLP
jgi:hypothetical protein